MEKTRRGKTVDRRPKTRRLAVFQLSISLQSLHRQCAFLSFHLSKAAQSERGEGKRGWGGETDLSIINRFSHFWLVLLGIIRVRFHLP